MRQLTIAIDGPAGAGKSTISKIIAKKLNIKYIDTGAMYRAVTYEVLKDGAKIEDNNILNKILRNIDIKLKNDRVYLNDEDVSEIIRLPRINEKVSDVAAIPSVRKRLVEIQRNMGKEESIIMDGRDIGTNVLPNADYKIFLTASVDERAKRRYDELIGKNIDITLDKVKVDIKNRDKIDSTRKINPLKKADDAVVVDTTGKDIDEVVNEIIKIVRS